MATPGAHDHAFLPCSRTVALPSRRRGVKLRPDRAEALRLPDVTPRRYATANGGRCSGEPPIFLHYCAERDGLRHVPINPTPNDGCEQMDTLRPIRRGDRQPRADLEAVAREGERACRW